MKFYRYAPLIATIYYNTMSWHY